MPYLFGDTIKSCPVQGWVSAAGTTEAMTAILGLDQSNDAVRDFLIDIVRLPTPPLRPILKNMPLKIWVAGA